MTLVPELLPQQTDGSGFSSTSLFPLGVTLQEFVAVDASGNTSSCSFTITVSDQEAPSLSIPVNLVIECNEDRTPANTGMAIATDNCDNTPIIIFNDLEFLFGCNGDRSYHANMDCYGC